MSENALASALKPENKIENRAFHKNETGISQSNDFPVEQILFLQRTIGNQAVKELMKSETLRAKLMIGQGGNEYEKLQAKTVSGLKPKVDPVIEKQIQSMKGSGNPLSESERAFFEPRFGADFSQVRVHTDTKAAEAARGVNARAFTTRHDVVFGEAQYAPDTTAGKTLLAHELTHVVQQGKNIGVQSMNNMLQRGKGHYSEAPIMINRAWNDCNTVADCPERAAGERTRAHAASLQVGVLTSPENGEIVSHFDIGSSNVSTLYSSPGWATFWGSLVTNNDRWEILGFSDCEGGIERNTELRWMRAMAVNNALPTLARAKIDRFRAAPLTDCVGENDTEAHRALNRSVVIKRTVMDYTFEAGPITGITCPPRSRAAVTSLADYVALLMCAETRTGYNHRNMLAMLRQIYYGKTWSSVSQTNKWDNVIPCSPNLGNPEASLGSNLYHALRNSPEIAGVDVGHVFTGLESMTCPSANVPFFGGLVAVSMPNEEFATWGGDFGAAAAAHVACPQLGASAATHEDCGGRTGTQPLAFYVNIHVPLQDLEGDIDAFVMRANLMGIPCTGSARSTFTPTRPMSEIFQDYYNVPSSGLGTAHARQHSCFLQTLGAIVSGGTITNRSLISPAISNRVFSFADAFYSKIRGMPIYSGPADRMHMRTNSRTVTNWFLTYLERQALSE